MMQQQPWLNPATYQNMAHEEVNWAALAQQWIAMKAASPPREAGAPKPPSQGFAQDGPPLPPPGPPPPASNFYPMPPGYGQPIYPPQGIPQTQLHQGWSHPQPQPQPPAQRREVGRYNWPNQDEGYGPTANKSWRPSRRSAFDQGPRFDQPRPAWKPERDDFNGDSSRNRTHRDMDYRKWSGAPSAPKHRSRDSTHHGHSQSSAVYVDDRSQSPSPPPVDEISMLQRKALPAWIREGLEKADREKARKAEEAAKKEEEDKAKIEERASRGLGRFDSSDEEEGGDTEENGETKEEDETDSRGPSPIFQSEEDKKETLGMCLRKWMTEILLEVTDAELEDLALSSLSKGGQAESESEGSSSEAEEEEEETKEASPTSDLPDSFKVPVLRPLPPMSKRKPPPPTTAALQAVASTEDTAQATSSRTSDRSSPDLAASPPDRKRARGSDKRSSSPSRRRKRSRSPRKRSPSPPKKARRRSRSPKRRSRSPKRRSRTPKRRSKSPKRKSSRSPSPVKKSRRRSPSPSSKKSKRRSGSPKKSRRRRSRSSS